MIGKNFIFDGNPIPYSTAEGSANGWLLDFNWNPPSVRNNTLSRQDFHGVVSHPTFAEGRLISVRGEIFHVDKASRGTIRKTIQNIFKLENFPSRDNQFKTLQFTDDDDTDWFIRAKVYTLPDITHERGDVIAQVFFQLFAEDPLIRSVDLQSVTGNYGLIGGISLPTTLPVALNSSLNSFVATNDGNFASPAKITITVDDAIGLNQNVIQYQTVMDDTKIVGSSASNEKFSYKFTAQEDKIGALTVAVAKNGNPTDYLRIALYSDDGAGKPNFLLKKIDVLGSSLSTGTSGDFANLDLLTEIFDYDVTIGVDYHIVIERSGALDAGDYYYIGVSSVNDGNANMLISSVWTAQPNQLYFKVHRPNSLINPKIYNLTTGKFFGINQTLYKNNTLIIDTDEVTAEIDGINVLADRADGSNWIFLIESGNAFLLTGDNFDFSHQDNASALVEYYHTRM
jgi:hypothetical protein